MCRTRKEARENFFAVSREDGFGVELYSLHRELAMAQRHDLAVVALGRDFERRWQGISLDGKRMVSAGFEWRRQIGEKRASIVPDHGCFPVHEPGSADYLSAICFRDALMAETDAQDGNLGPEAQNHFFADARFTRRAWPGRNADVIGC